MGYKDVAIKAAQLAISTNISPVDAWEREVKKEFPNSQSSQEKGCPKNTFLGLCEEGKIKGINRGKYTSSKLNKQYALTAIGILVNNKNKDYSPLDLWHKVLQLQRADLNKGYNSQMEVVLALWNHGMVVF